MTHVAVRRTEGRNMRSPIIGLALVDLGTALAGAPAGAQDLQQKLGAAKASAARNQRQLDVTITRSNYQTLAQ